MSTRPPLRLLPLLLLVGCPHDPPAPAPAAAGPAARAMDPEAIRGVSDPELQEIARQTGGQFRFVPGAGR